MHACAGSSSMRSFGFRPGGGSGGLPAMNAPHPSRSLPVGFVDRLRQALGDRLQLGAAVRLEHGRSETHFAPMPPDGVLFAESIGDVVAAVMLCAEFGVPVVAFGAGTSVEGNALAVRGGLSLDLSR